MRSPVRWEYTVFHDVAACVASTAVVHVHITSCTMLVFREREKKKVAFRLPL